MPQVNIPDTDVVQAFLDTITIATDGKNPAIPLQVKCYPGQRWWYIVAFTSDGRALCPMRLLCTTPNAWAAQEASIAAMFGRSLVCRVAGETDATKPLFGQCTITIDAQTNSGFELETA